MCQPELKPQHSDAGIAAKLSIHSDAADDVCPIIDTSASISSAKTTSTSSNENKSENDAPPPLSWCRRGINFYWKQEFLILVVLAIPLARLYPELGAVYLKPAITATWIAVSLIFFLSGLTLRAKDLKSASLNMRYNLLILAFNFGVVSSIVFGVSRALARSGWISRDLADGLTVCGCLPVTVNMAIVLAEVAGADRAAAVFITAASNLSGVFISPLLILAYLGVNGNVDLWEVFYKLALRVIVPMFVGQLCRFAEFVRNFVQNNKPGFKRAQQYLLIYIIYTIFCRALKGGSDNEPGSILLVILFQFILLSGMMVMAWFSLRYLYPDQPKLRVTGLFGCTHKTISIGVPLINAIYGSHPNIGLYTLPILIWHPMQLVIGTLLMPKLQAFIQREQERLGIQDDSVTGGEEASAAPTADDAPIVDSLEASEAGLVQTPDVVQQRKPENSAF